MRVELGDLVVALLVLILGLVGLVMASRALDDEIYIFGLALAGFATLFELGLVKRHFDRGAAARMQGAGHV